MQKIFPKEDLLYRIHLWGDSKQKEITGKGRLKHRTIYAWKE